MFFEDIFDITDDDMWLSIISILASIDEEVELEENERTGDYYELE